MATSDTEDGVELSPPVRSMKTDFAYNEWQKARHNVRRVETLFFRFGRASRDDLARAKADADHAWRRWDAACRAARKETEQ